MYELTTDQVEDSSTKLGKAKQYVIPTCTEVGTQSPEHADNAPPGEMPK